MRLSTKGFGTPVVMSNKRAERSASVRTVVQTSRARREEVESRRLCRNGVLRRKRKFRSNSVMAPFSGLHNERLRLLIRVELLCCSWLHKQERRSSSCGPGMSTGCTVSALILEAAAFFRQRFVA